MGLARVISGWTRDDPLDSEAGDRLCDEFFWPLYAIFQNMKNIEIGKKGSRLSALLFGFGILIYGWPVLSIAAETSVLGLFTYVYLTWGALVVLTFLISRTSNLSDGKDPLDDQDGPND